MPRFKLTDAFLSEVAKDIFVDIIGELENEPPVKKTRTGRTNKIDYWETPWGKLITCDRVMNIKTKEGKLFRRRFRIPFLLFKDALVPLCREYNIFDTKNENAVRVPLEFKILYSLRILGRGNCCDDIAEIGISFESTVNWIFKKFISGVRKHLYPLYVKIHTGEKLQKCMQQYADCGQPGCAGSVDACHFFMNKTPVSVVNNCIGKEGKPTMGFNMICDHRRYIQYCSPGFYGSYNDHNKTNGDIEFLEILDGLSDIQFFFFDDNEAVVCIKGAYFIVDGGYPKVRSLIDGYRNRFTRNEIMWSEWLESIRKDIECTFGILKGRFRFLLHAMEYHKCQTTYKRKQQLVQCFFRCSIPNNIGYFIAFQSSRVNF